MERCKRVKLREHHLLRVRLPARLPATPTATAPSLTRCPGLSWRQEVAAPSAVHAPPPPLGALVEQLLAHHGGDTVVPGEAEAVPGDALCAQAATELVACARRLVDKHREVLYKEARVRRRPFFFARSRG